VRGLEIVNEEGDCVEPTDETIASGTYPFSRTLFIYVNARSARDNDAVRRFIDAYLGPESDALVRDAGYVPLSESVKQAAFDAWGALS
jgi:phosphate transport system substrate-binding protein